MKRRGRSAARSKPAILGALLLWGGAPGFPPDMHPGPSHGNAGHTGTSSRGSSDPCAVPPIPGGAVLCGQVRDGRTGEIPNQVVVAVHAHRNGTIADPGGGYRLDLPTGLVWVAADRVGYHPWVRPVRLAPGDVRRLPIALTPSVGWSDPITPGFPPGDRCPTQPSIATSRLSGRIVSERGMPLAGIRVWVGVLQGDEPGCGAVTDEAGVFALPGLPPGQMTLVASPAEDVGLLASPSRPPVGALPLLERSITLSAKDSLPRDFLLPGGG